MIYIPYAKIAQTTNDNVVIHPKLFITSTKSPTGIGNRQY